MHGDRWARPTCRAVPGKKGHGRHGKEQAASSLVPWQKGVEKATRSMCRASFDNFRYGFNKSHATAYASSATRRPT